MTPLKITRYLGGAIIDVIAIGAIGYTTSHVYQMYKHHSHSDPLIPLVGGLILAAGLHGCARHARGTENREKSELVDRILK